MVNKIIRIHYNNKVYNAHSCTLHNHYYDKLVISKGININVYGFNLWVDKAYLIAYRKGI